MRYKTVIGLEIHAQLLTESKAFCTCRNDSSETEPNTNICPVCTAHPGTLPVLNGKMIGLSVKAALALKCSINSISNFDRKNYFYPDMPKGYQITQYFHPIAENGKIEIISNRRKKMVRIRRIHMEEDSAKLIHEDDRTLVDFNRSGIPLIEIVTEPDMNSAEEAVMFLEELRNILRCIKVCDGNLENGSMRCDVNISVMDTQTGISTNRVEIKNLNSFRNVQRALRYEENVHQNLLMGGEKGFQSTKSWDEKRRITMVMRDKETEMDYRYFPEPDLPLVEILETEIERLQKLIPELPSEKRLRFVEQYHLKFEEARILSISPELAVFFEQTASLAEASEVIKWILRDVKRYLNEKKINLSETCLTPEKLAGLLDWIKTGRISYHTAKEILIALIETNRASEEIISEYDFIQQNDPDILNDFLEQIIEEHFEEYEAYCLGKKELFNFFVGKMMGLTKGRTRPELIIKTIKNRLG